MNRKKEYSLSGQLAENAGVHCACLVITKNMVKDKNGWLRPAQASDSLRNGTITFVKSDNKVYGITCLHVVEHLRELVEQYGLASHSFYTMVNGFYAVLDRFVRPTSDTEYHQLDVVIRELNPDHLEAIGKIPIDLDNQDEPNEIEFGYAVGFPETMKYKIMEPTVGYRVSMPQVEILAEINKKPNQRFTLFSELDTVPSQTDYSGMSGGPIFWSNKETYGIYGIAYEAGTGGEFTGDKGIFVYGELATPTVIKSWISQYHDKKEK